MQNLELRLHDTVTQVITDRLIDDIKRHRGREITLDIDSPGGSVRYGYQLFQALQDAKKRGAKIAVNITGRAASMGSIIAMAGDVRRIAADGLIMVHDPLVLTRGNATELRELAAMMDELGGDLADVYAQRTGQPKAKILGLMRTETYMDAATAKRLGFVDEIVQTGAKPLPKTLLERIAAVERLADEASTASRNPSKANMRRVETTARRTSAALAKHRRQEPSAIADLLRTMNHREAAACDARAACFAESGKAGRDQLRAAMATATPEQRKQLEERFPRTLESHLYKQDR